MDCVKATKFISQRKIIPGRPAVSQLDDPTYIICKYLTYILNPIDEAPKLYIMNSFHLKQMLMPARIMGKKYILVLFDVTVLYPMIPVDKALKVVLKKLKQDKTLKERTEWTPEVLKICLETHFVNFGGNILWTQMVLQLESLFQDRLQGYTWPFMKKS